MNEQIKTISIKLLLTIPAIFIGILSAIVYILKPAIDLWVDKKEEPIPQKKEEDTLDNHVFM